jgi:hypothetical protein
MKISPPAFPTYLADNMAHGMSLRDYLAAAALPSVIQSWYRTDEEIVCAEEEDAECVAKIAYELADAMMKARNK